MGIQNKIKNIRLFGIKSCLPSVKYRIMFGLVLVATFFFLGNYMFNEGTNQITGSIVESSQLTDSSDNSALSNQNPAEIVEEIEKEISENEEEGYDVYEYYEYGGECSLKIKGAEDDVGDTLRYSGFDEDRYNTLKDEYNQKLDELKEQYEYQIDDAKKDYDKSQSEVWEAQDKLQELQEICAY